jgi:ornithine cyclodeaminase
MPTPTEEGRVHGAPMMDMTIPYLSDSTIGQLLDFKSVVAQLDAAFADLSRGEAAIHGRQRSECAGIKLSTMGALWTAQGVGGVKVYPTVGGQFSFAVLLFDLRSNRPLAMLDANALTRFRTAAITTLVASKVVRPGARKLALFGAGLQGRAQAECLSEAFRFSEIAVVDPQADAAWCTQLLQRSGAEVLSCEPRAALRDADIVVTATRGAQPVFDGDGLSPGAFVSAIGSSSPTVRELDDRTLARADRVIVEWRPQSLAEAGEIVQWQLGRDIDKCVDLPELYRRPGAWAARPEAITVFKSVGVGLADVATALLAWQRSRDQ